MEPMIEEVMGCHPARIWAHNDDGEMPESQVQVWHGCGAAMWRVREDEDIAYGGRLLHWPAMLRILEGDGDPVDLDALPEGHYVDARIMAVARERSVRLDAIWVNDCEPGPGVMVRGYNDAGEIVFVGMGKREDP